MFDVLHDLWLDLLLIPHLGLYLGIGWGLYLVGLGGWIVLQKREPAATISWLLGLALLVQADHYTDRNYVYSALSGILPGMIIAMASLRRRLWRRNDSPFARMLSLARD